MRSGELKGRWLTAMIIVILLSLSVQPVSAENTQGLEWGVENGSKIYYKNEFHYPQSKTGVTAYDGIETVYVNVTDLKLLPDYADNCLDLLGSSYQIHWANGTELPRKMLPFEFWILPIGNWSLLTWLFEPLNFGHSNTKTIEETDTTWIVNMTEVGHDWIWDWNMAFSKLDGLPLYYYFEDYSTVGTTDHIVYTQEFIRVKSPIEMLVIGVCVSLVVVVLVIVVYTYRSKTVE